MENKEKITHQPDNCGKTLNSNMAFRHGVDKCHETSISNVALRTESDNISKTVKPNFAFEHEGDETLNIALRHEIIVVRKP